MGVAAELIQVLGDLQVITGLLQNLQGLNNQAVTKGDLNAFSAQVFAQLGLIQNQQLAILAQERQIWSDLINRLGGLGVQVGAPQQATRPVELPGTPPAGYGGTDAAGVWSYILPSSGSTAGAALDNANEYAVALSEKPWPRIAGQPFLQPIVHFNWLGLGFWTPNPQPPLDISTILETDATPEDWVNREYSGYGWITVNQSANWQPLAYPDGGTANVYWALDMTQAEFLAIKQARGLLPGLSAAPVWPGLANVTLGVPAALAGSGITVVGPMDGIILELTTVPQPRPQYNFNGTISWGKMGGVAFEDDNGDTEEQQLVGFEHAVYVPKSMRSATFCNLRYPSGTLGTATPWTKT